MASYAALTTLSQTLDQIPQPNQQITYLQCKCAVLRHLLTVLDDSPLKGSLTVKHLERRTRDASYEAEDVIHSQISEQVLSEPESRTVGCFFRKTVHMPRLMDLEFRGLEEIIDEFDSILDDLSDKIKYGSVEHLPPKNSLAVDPSSFVAGDKSTVVGLDEDLLQLKDWLTGSPSRLDIISIVGLGGIGKTTLARNLYDDLLIQEHFYTRAWIVVSQEYHLREMFTGLLDSTRHGGDGELHIKEIHELAQLLSQSLMGRRYLIVMDDVWDTQAWNDVRRFFPDDNNGSRIVLTTRLSEVAACAGSHSTIHHMNLLRPKESWNLLRENLFGKESCPSELEETGKKIAENCKGLPLAISVVSGLLHKGSKTQDYWQFIAKNVKSAVTDGNDQFIEILSMSYDSLPCHLKPCFLYMGGFPEDYKISISDLIKLWIAEGFVQPEVHKSLEEVAKDYLKNLIDRSLIMAQKRIDYIGDRSLIMGQKRIDYIGRETHVFIHDMLRELCVKKAEDENFLHTLNSNSCHFPPDINNLRRVSMHSKVFSHSIPYVHNSLVRSLQYFGNSYGSHSLFLSKILSINGDCKLLRVLDAIEVPFHKFPIQILELIHLRYLAFCYMNKTKTKTKSKLPASISKLQNLQTLVVSSYKILYLPLSIWEMPQLRHLHFGKSFLPAPITMKDSVVIENLQTLSNVRSFRCTRKVVEMVPNLKELVVSYSCGAFTDWSSYEFHNFVRLHQLERMECRLFGWHKRPQPSIVFSFPANLKHLVLGGWRLPWEKMTVIGSLPNLEVLILTEHAFKGSIWEPNEGEFNKLRVLRIESSDLEHWRANETHFPRLQQLIFYLCWNLVEIPSEIGEIPTLEMLDLRCASSSAKESAKLIREEQQSLENNTLRVLC